MPDGTLPPFQTAQASDKKRERLRAADARYRAKNRDKRRAASARYRAENREKVRAAEAAYQASHRTRYYAAHPEKRRAMDARHYVKNREKILVAKVAYRTARPEKIRENNTRRRARKRGADGIFTAADWLTLVARSPSCHWCKKPFSKTRRPTHDHIIPLSKRGPNNPENSVCACLSCNIKKGARLFNPTSGHGLLI